MSERFVLDTDTVVDVLRGHAEVAAQLGAVSPDDVAVSAMTVAELLYGARRSSNPRRNRAEIERLLEEVRVLAFGPRAAVVHAEVRERLRHQPIGPDDLVIAATAIAVRATLVTSTMREFARVPGLRAVSWRLVDARSDATRSGG